MYIYFFLQDRNRQKTVYKVPRNPVHHGLSFVRGFAFYKKNTEFYRGIRASKL